MTQSDQSKMHRISLTLTRDGSILRLTTADFDEEEQAWMVWSHLCMALGVEVER